MTAVFSRDNEKRNAAKELNYAVAHSARMPAASVSYGMSIDRLAHRNESAPSGYGVGVVKALTEHTADISFDGRAAHGCARAERIGISGTDRHAERVADAAREFDPRDRAGGGGIARLGEGGSDRGGNRATAGKAARLVMQSADTSLQPKDVPLETFFHKIVMIRNNLARARAEGERERKTDAKRTSSICSNTSRAATDRSRLSTFSSRTRRISSARNEFQ